MPIAELLKKNREEKGLSQEDLAKSLSIPVDLVAFIEDPKESEAKIVEFFAAGMNITPEIFRGEVPLKPPEQEEEEIATTAVENAKYPNIRQFILNPERCENPEKAKKLFMKEELSLSEQNVILYLSTTALYHFCDTNYSSFAYDDYLFKLHGTLLKKFELELKRAGLSQDENEERLNNARSNIFGCDKVENIAIRVFSQFAGEMEEKLAGGVEDFNEDLDLPFTWSIDEDLMKIEIKDQKGNVKDEIKLLDVKERK